MIYNVLGIHEQCINNDGLWVKLDHTSQQKYCYTSEGEAWSLAVGRGETVHLRLHGNMLI